jgi:hypothetical protein
MLVAICGSIPAHIFYQTAGWESTPVPRKHGKTKPRTLTRVHEHKIGGLHSTSCAEKVPTGIQLQSRPRTNAILHAAEHSAVFTH